MSDANALALRMRDEYKWPNASADEEDDFDPKAYRDDLIAYYSEVGPEYQAWSTDFHMHFGFYRAGMNPAQLEPMLEQMSREVLDRLAPASGEQLLDAGCGLGSVARQCVRTFAGCRVIGINIVPWAINEAQRLSRASGTESATDYVCCDYAQLPFGDAGFNGIYAIESACHAPQRDLVRLLKGFHRVLKPRCRVVFADGFLRHADPMPGWLERLYRAFCKGWALESLANLPEFVEALEKAGFEDIRVEDISWRILPSAVFIPVAATRMLRAKLARPNGRLSRRQWAHLASPFAVPAFTAFPRRFGYFFITATKPA